MSDVHILFVQMHGFIKFYIISAIKLCTCLRSTGSMSRSALSFCPSISFTFFTLFSISSTSDGWFFMIWFFSTLRGKMSTIKPRSLSFESHLSLGIKLKVSYFFFGDSNIFHGWFGLSSSPYWYDQWFFIDCFET